MSNNNELPGRPFSDVLAEIDGGRLLYDLTEAVYNLTAQCREIRKAGKLTLEIDFVPTGAATLALKPKLKVKEPEFDRNATTFFAGDDHSLHREDPRQMRIPLREVSHPDRQMEKEATNDD